MKFKKLERVDIQVCVFVAIVVLLSFTCVYISNYYFTYKDMINTLSERTISIYNFVDETLDKRTFSEVRTVADQDKNCYLETKAFLEKTKQVTGAMYLYTAIKNEKGEFIYLVDGLDVDSSDFRNAGDLIEEEIIGDMDTALGDEVVMPRKIKNTAWGDVFVGYFPIHENGEVVGVLGLEFDAQHQYKTFRIIAIMTPLIGLIACIIAVIVALRLFRRISNPTRKDMYNTDKLTGVKNRNSFEIDINNLIHRNNQEGKMIISIDLNGLKAVNDNLGHDAGDKYIKISADILKNAISEDEVIYRTGGDEFVIIAENKNNYGDYLLKKIIEQIEIVNDNGDNISMAIGMSVFKKETDRNLLETYRKADKEMYKNKQEMKNAINTK